MAPMTTLEIARLTTQERLDLIGELWDSLAPKDVDLTPAQAAELGRRLQTFDDGEKVAVA
jgi:putative addiction module component (TIGR02574 family)